MILKTIHGTRVMLLLVLKSFRSAETDIYKSKKINKDRELKRNKNILIEEEQTLRERRMTYKKRKRTS